MHQENDKKIIFWLEEHKAAEVDGQVVRVLHDIWCALWAGQACNCEPEIEVQGKRISYPREILEGK